MKLISTIRFVFVFILASGFVGQLVAQTPSLDALGRQGPYQVASFTQLPSVPEFSDATLYYPANKAQGFAGVVISPGFFERQENISWWGNYLASHGFAVITFDTNELNDLPPLRAVALLAAIGLLPCLVVAEESQPAQVLFKNVNVFDGTGDKLAMGMDVLVEGNLN